MRIADSKSICILQSAIVNRLAEAAGVEPAHAMRGDLANRCHTIRRRLQRFRIADVGLRIGVFASFLIEPIRIPHSAMSNRLAEGTGVEPASDKCAVVFGTTPLQVSLPLRWEER